MAAVVVPAKPDGTAWPDGMVDVVLKGASGAEDTGFSAFTFDASRPVNLIDDAMTRPLSAEMQQGGTAELMAGVSWHLAYCPPVRGRLSVHSVFHSKSGLCVSSVF
jgi:hypothetical protein